MRHYSCMTFGALFVSAILIGASLTGCRNAGETPSPEETEQAAAESTGAAGENGSQPAEAKPAPEPEPVKLTMPEVKLTEALEKTCLVKVGDQMPEVTLPRLDGQAASLGSLSGEKMTVLCFWKADHPYSLEELRQLEKFIAAPYASQGVRVIAINENDPPNVAGKAYRDTGATYPCLLDSQGSYFMKVATKDLPRTYLLDATGKILWFDLDYSRGTLRDLEQAIKFVLEPKEEQQQ